MPCSSRTYSAGLARARVQGHVPARRVIPLTHPVDKEVRLRVFTAGASKDHLNIGVTRAAPEPLEGVRHLFRRVFLFRHVCWVFLRVPISLSPLATCSCVLSIC